MRPTGLRARGSIRALAAVVTATQMAVVSAAAKDSTLELASSGLAIVPNPSLVVRRLDLAISSERVRLKYVVLNLGAADVTSLVTWPLPEIDTIAVGDAALALPATDPDNFVRFEITSDGKPLKPSLEQHALAFRLDVTSLLKDQGLPLFPFAETVGSRLAALPDAVFQGMLENGIARVEGHRRHPSWTYRATAFWRQVFKAERSTEIAVSFVPVLGSGDLGADSLASFGQSHCLTGAKAKAIQQRIEGGGAVDAVWLTHALTFGSSWSGPVKRARITVELQDANTIVATCHAGFKPAGPTLLEWEATDFEPSSDLSILLVR